MNKNIPNKIIVHHTADKTNAPQISKVNQYHKIRTFPQSSLGYFVGYHYFIEKNGDVIQCRKINDEGAHTIGENLSSIGIGLAGNFDIEMPTALQIQSMVRLIDKLIKSTIITISTIYPHRHFSPTSCYGILLKDDWAEKQYRIFLNNKLLTALIALKGLYEKLIFLKWKIQNHLN